MSAQLQPAPKGAGTAGVGGPVATRRSPPASTTSCTATRRSGRCSCCCSRSCTSRITADRFLAPANLSLIVQQVMVVGTLGIAQTLIILTAGIDLSVGAIMVLSSIVMAKLSADSGRARPARAAARLLASARPAG